MEGNSFCPAEGDGALRVEKRRINAFRYPKIWWVFVFFFWLPLICHSGGFLPISRSRRIFFILLGALAWPLFFFIKIPFAVIPGEVSQPSPSAWWNRREKFRLCSPFSAVLMCFSVHVWCIVKTGFSAFPLSTRCLFMMVVVGDLLSLCCLYAS